MALAQAPRPATIPRSRIDGLPSFRLRSEAIPDGQYKIKGPKEEENHSDDAEIQSKVWFKTPALDPLTIRRIDYVQLYAESHDQGFCDNPDGGAWTWLELGIYEDEHAESPRVKDGIELVWRSHFNVLANAEFQWLEGERFEETHDLVRSLEDGNVIGVRLCSRFAGWKIHARNGYLLFDIGIEIDRAPPPAYADVVAEMTTIGNTLQEVNAQTGALFNPTVSTQIFRADAFGTGNKRPLRVLSLDGGGVRGLLSLQILQTVMDRAAPGKKPCEVFDMIAGTSTGGLIAILLGRLRMDVKECIETYTNVMGDVFPEGTWKKTRFLAKGEFYDEKPLEDAIKKVVESKLKDPEAKLMDDESNPCKIFVMAVRKDAANNRGPVFLRPYINKSPPDESAIQIPDIKIWEAARATSAAPAYFKPFAIGKYELLDGGLGANNPLGWLWTETLSVFGPARSTDCFLSVGTGIPANQDIPRPSQVTKVMDTVEAFASIATNSELIHILFRTLIDAFAPHPGGKKYWRMNIGTRIGDWDENTGTWPLTNKVVHHYDDYAKIGELDDAKALEGLRKVTATYIEENKGMINECARVLAGSLKLQEE
ncbi:acyl transferase/acyl hydrolase/lysophospholipase [Massariosphaeria phaeospora]|uniref:Acyl transferase/acyl hydrolase/lysophospholipase n=1 Tax=Massariosphaeria phaeospora TaxID=100035 RepID=A0A7C8IB35_9PLEO|nr:acyl transferase/acyl hydrolase/lysophospholipase [Massariosphaeria phaeospora]